MWRSMLWLKCAMRSYLPKLRNMKSHKICPAQSFTCLRQKKIHRVQCGLTLQQGCIRLHLLFSNGVLFLSCTQCYSSTLAFSDRQRSSSRDNPLRSSLVWKHDIQPGKWSTGECPMINLVWIHKMKCCLLCNSILFQLTKRMNFKLLGVGVGVSFKKEKRQK